MSIGSAVFAQRTTECPITLQWAATPSQKNCPFALGDLVPHQTHGTYGPTRHQPERHLDRLSRFHMVPKWYAVQCIVSGQENPQNCPSLGISSPRQRRTEPRP